MRAFVLGLVLASVGGAVAQTPASSTLVYQGKLAHAGVPAEGSIDLLFRLFDAEAGGVQVGQAVQRLDVEVAEGQFSVALNFGDSVFIGLERWLEVGVFDDASGQFVATTPRQPLTATPFAVSALETEHWRTVDGHVTSANAGQFVGIHRAARVSASEYFGVQALVQSGYGGMYIDTRGAAGRPFYGYGAGTDTLWTTFDGTTLDWSLVHGGTPLRVGRTGAVGINASLPQNRLNVDGGGLTQGLYATNTGGGHAGRFELPVGTPAAALLATTAGDGKAALFESHVPNGIPAMTVYKNNGTAIRTDGDLVVDGRLRGRTGAATSRLTPIAYVRYKSLYDPLEVIASSPNVSVYPASAFVTIEVHGESNPSSWVVLATHSFADMEASGYDELNVCFANDDDDPRIRVWTSCFNWPADPDSCFSVPQDDVFTDVVVYKPQ